MRVIIWGTSSMGHEIATKILTDTYYLDEKKREIICFIDSNPAKWGTGILDTYLIEEPNKIRDLVFDEIIIASWAGYQEIKDTLSATYQVPLEKINNEYCKIANDSRKIFLDSCAKKNTSWHQSQFSIAELGVFQGDFAKEMNRFFPYNDLFLFDTFEGFDSRDLISEEQHVKKLKSHLSNTSVKMVLNKMPNPNKVHIKQGWFPQSCYTEGGGDVINRQFCFVNIDTDLHDSVLAGLEFFYPRMIAGGIILVHDYFSFFYTGVKKAVDNFCDKNQITSFPIGDILSIAILKTT